MSNAIPKNAREYRRIGFSLLTDCRKAQRRVFGSLVELEFGPDKASALADLSRLAGEAKAAAIKLADHLGLEFPLPHKSESN